MLYVWIAIAVTVLFLVWQIIRSWNLPKVAKARAEKVKARQAGRTERVRIRRTREKRVSEKRRRWFFRRNK